MMMIKINLFIKKEIMYKKLFLVLLFISVLLTLTSCGQIEDINGSNDYSLNTLTDEDFFINTNVVKIGSVTTRFNNTVKISVKKMSGVDRIEKINLSLGSLTITTNLNVTSGNIKLVLIMNDTIIKEFKINAEDSYTGTISGNYELKIAAESAKFNLSYTIEK